MEVRLNVRISGLNGQTDQTPFARIDQAAEFGQESGTHVRAIKVLF
jgi:hypothetical protein